MDTPHLHESDEALLAALREAGDDASIPRPVEHFVHFASEQDAMEAAEDAQMLGFAVNAVMQQEDPDSELPFTVMLRQFAMTTPEAIAAARFLLEEIAGAYEGTYDGWGCLPIAGWDALFDAIDRGAFDSDDEDEDDAG